MGNLDTKRGCCGDPLERHRCVEQPNTTTTLWMGQEVRTAMMEKILHTGMPCSLTQTSLQSEPCTFVREVYFVFERQPDGVSPASVLVPFGSPQLWSCQEIGEGIPR